MFLVPDFLANCQVLKLTDLQSDHNDMFRLANHDNVAVVGVVLTAKFKSVYSRKNNLVGLLEIHLIDESSAESPIIYQCWGQNASDKFRFEVCGGCTVIVHNVLTHKSNNNGHISTTLKGDIVLVLNGVHGARKAHSGSEQWSGALQAKLALLAEWSSSHALVSLIRCVMMLCLSPAER